VRASLAAVLVIALVTGCGSSGGGSKRNAAKPGTLDAIWRQAGPAVALVPGSTDFAPGQVRVSFLVVDPRGQVIERPQARFWIARGREDAPFAQTTAKLEPIGVGGEGADSGLKSLYVANVRVRSPGHYWVVARPIGGTPIGGIQEVVVNPKSSTPSLGAKAYPSRTPTLATAPAAKLTTRRPPDRALLRDSVAASLAAHRPFVVTFATPRFCESRTCGPVVDVVDAARKRFARRGIRFIHVEIYKDNDPRKGQNRWVKEWHLPSEPWTFLVGNDGRIKAKFAGSVSLDELSAAIRRYLA
jgi:hypothetical protein